MKRLLLLLILCPVILFGQTKRKAIVDSIKAETANIEGVSALIRHVPGSRVEHIDATDSGEYVTVVVRFRVTEPILITELPLLSIFKVKIGSIIPAELSELIIPPLYKLFAEPDTILALSLISIVRLNMEDIPFIKGKPVEIPNLSHIDLMPTEAVPILAVTLFRNEDIVAGMAHLVAVPALAEILPETIVPLPVLPVTLFKIADILIGAARVMPIPPISEVDLEAPESLPLFALFKLPVDYHPAAKIDSIEIPVFEERKMPVEGMHLSADGYSLLEKLEGFSPMPYALKDGGLTIGFGFFVPYGEGSMWKRGMTWEEAEQIIRQKMPLYENQVKQYINVPLTQNEFDALTMLAYNLGGFSKATSIVNDVNRQADFDRIQIDWKRFVHSKAPGVTKGLMNRRRDELQVRNESDYQPERKIQILKNMK